jgi:hypothetical protein
VSSEGADAVDGDGKKKDGIYVFGFNIKDPQDILSIVLYTVIVYNIGDLIYFYGSKLFQGAGAPSA